MVGLGAGWHGWRWWWWGRHGGRQPTGTVGGAVPVQGATKAFFLAVQNFDGKAGKKKARSAPPGLHGGGSQEGQYESHIFYR